MSATKTSKWGSSFFGTVPAEGRGDRPAAPAPYDRVDSRVVNVASEAEQGDGLQVAADGIGKIKFKRAKKLTKKTAGSTQHYTKAFTDTKSSRFQEWTKMEMVTLLVNEGVELRNESSIEKGSLRDLCDALYFEREMPPKPKLPTLFDIVTMNAAARKVQNAWVLRQYQKRHAEENEQSEAYIRRLQEEEDGHDELGIGAAELAYMSAPREIMVAGQVDELPVDDQPLGSEGTEGDSTGAGTDPTTGTTTTPAKRKGNNVLDTPWVPPDVTKAQRFADYVQPRKGGKGGSKFDFMNTTTGRHCCLGNMGEQLDLWEEGQISEFGIYGSGVTNYFKFIKWCFWLFLVLAVVSIPAVVLNASGANSHSNRGLDTLAQTTAGNLVSPFANVSVSLRIPGCNSYGVYDVDCSLDKTSLATFYSSLDIAIVIIAFLAFLWLRVFEVVEERNLEKNTVNASMFTVTVSRLPDDCTEEELIAHFGKICPTHKIANISMAFDNRQEIEEASKRGDIIRAKVRAVHEHRHYCTKLKQKLGNNAAEKITKEREKFYLRMATLTQELKAKEDLLAKLAETPAKPIFAFVTFDRAAGREAILEAFNGHAWLYNYFYNQKLKFKGKWLCVEPSPEPSTILWENLAYGKWDCYRRRAFTSFVALLIIIVSLAMIFSSKYLEQVNANKHAAELCPTGFDSYSEEDKKEYVKQNPDQLSCYCDELNTFQQSADELCQDYLRRNVQSQVLNYFASVMVLLVNIAIEKLLKTLSAFEKHNNEDERGLSTFLRLFILKYINTTLVFFINNNNVVLQKIFGVKTASTTEFTADWFNTIGVTVILVQLGDIFSCHGDKVMKWIKYHRRKRIARVKELALTQDELNKTEIGPEFEFSFSYAQLLSTIFCCFTFSTGIPILYLICAANFFVYYFVEKYLFIHLHRVPPHFGNNVGKRATAMLPYAFVLHLVMSIWMLSNKEIFLNEQDGSNGVSTVNSGNSSLQERINGEATFPLCVFLLAIIAIRAATHFYKAFSKTIIRMLESCCGTRCTQSCTGAKKKAASAMAVVTYTRAVQRNLIKGLATYNILQNPKYKESFAITWKFAMSNKSVRSVRMNKARAQVTNDETDADKVEQMQRTINPRGLNRKMSNRGFSGNFYGTQDGEGGEGVAGAGEGEAIDEGGVQMESMGPSTASTESMSRPTSTTRSPRAGGGQSPRSGPSSPRAAPQAHAASLPPGVDLAEQQRLYAQAQTQYRAQQGGQSPANRQARGGRTVNVGPLGQQPQHRPVPGATPYAYGRPVSGGPAYAQPVPVPGYGPNGVPVAQQMYRPGSGAYPAQAAQAYAYQGMPQPPPGSQSQRSAPRARAQTRPQPQGQGRPMQGGSAHGYAPVSRGGPNLDADGFENADHLLYD